MAFVLYTTCNMLRSISKHTWLIRTDRTNGNNNAMYIITTVTT